ncbi:LacI family transcriptional regulator [Bacillus sp. J14TS2]|uniref:LacI family DNA-binding transcriptional regulator n=1 Tax=Bacillus sp. J14TS2 TaxID=2807188 RepID=UPI001B2AE79E|nr:LacI family DNA-binding transcriptional regulator [Bacillus sp. J14TS2]GIN71607.1 LacI family transcriptional regulator [Bacillus sp. J14TS2]
MVSIKKIAELAGVSMSTASFILNGKGDEARIAKATQKKVLELARELGYSPNIAARRLRGGKGNMVPVIAIFWTIDTRTSLISRFLRGINFSYHSHESEFELVIQPYVNSELKNVKSLFTGNNFNGAIIANASDEDLLHLENNEVNVPIVLYQRKSKKFSSVLVDSVQTGSDVARLFHSRKHKNVGLIQPSISSQAVQLRKEGFLNELKKYEMYLSDQHIIEGDFSEEGGYHCALELINQQILPSAIFSLSDHMAIGALAAFHKAGINIPKDIEMIGYDDNENSRFSIPSLTTVHLPVEDMANECLNILLELIHQKAKQPIAREWTTSIVIRDSCGDFF